ncbi:MAG: HEAT repeat domain-containing protein [Planctomycetota bacterium]
MTQGRWILPIVLLAMARPAAAQELPSLEKLLEEANRAVAEQKDKIRENVEEAVKTFRRASKGANGADEVEVRAQRLRVASLGPAALPDLMTALRAEKNAGVVANIADTVAAIRDPASIAPLLEFASQADPEPAAAAIRAVGLIGDRESVPSVLALAEATPDGPVHASCLVALARLEADAAHPLWERGVQSRSSVVRAAAVEALGLVGRSGDVKLVSERLTDDNDDVVFAAIDAIGRLAERTRSSQALKALHEVLARENQAFVDAALTVVGKVGNDTSKGHLKSLVDRLGADEANAGFEGTIRLRKRAAITLYQLGDVYGRDELAKPHKKAIRAARNARAARGQWEALSDLYWEFGDWKSAIDATEKAIDPQEIRSLQTNNLRIARCYARLGNFSRAAKFLQKAEGAPPWVDVADDESFREMRQDRRYRDKFER